MPQVVFSTSKLPPRKSVSPKQLICKRSSPKTRSCKGDKDILSIVEFEPIRSAKLDDRQKWVRQVASATRDKMMMNQSEQIAQQ